MCQCSRGTTKRYSRNQTFVTFVESDAIVKCSFRSMHLVYLGIVRTFVRGSLSQRFIKET